MGEMPTSRTEEQRLRLFCHCVQDAVRLRAIRDCTIRAKVTVSFGSDSYVETDLGDEDQNRSLFLAVRKIKANGEDTQYEKISNIVELRITDDFLRSANRKNRAAWKQAMAGQVGLHVSGKNYGARALWDIYSNSQLFHTAPHHLAAWESFDDVTQCIALQQVNTMVVHSLVVAQAQRNLIEKAFTEGHFAGLS